MKVMTASFVAMGGGMEAVTEAVTTCSCQSLGDHNWNGQTWCFSEVNFLYLVVNGPILGFMMVHHFYHFLSPIFPAVHVLSCVIYFVQCSNI